MPRPVATSETSGRCPPRPGSAGAVALGLLAALWTIGATHLARAACDVVPQAEQSFRSALGTTDRPFASPGDWVTLRLDPVCHSDSSSLVEDGSPTPPDVVVAFVPPDPAAPRNVVVLTASCAGIASRLAACEQQIGRAPLCIDAAGAPPSQNEIVVLSETAIRFRFPDTRGHPSHPLAGLGSDLTLSGPVRIAVSRPSAPALACQIATSACPSQPSASVAACVDRLFVSGDTCSQAPHATFAGFTALPLPNDFGGLCMQPSPPCTGAADELRFTTDAAGNVLLPVDWSGVLVARDEVPVPRTLDTVANLEAFPGSGATLLVTSVSALASYSPKGARIQPVFDPQFDATGTANTRLFGTADAPRTVLRVARHEEKGVRRQCAGGARVGFPCICPDDADCATSACPGSVCSRNLTCFAAGVPTAAACSSSTDCPAGEECGPGLFDFSTRPAAGVGPVVARRGTCLGGTRPLEACTGNGQCPGGRCSVLNARALDPVPLDGLVQTRSINAFVKEEAISEKDLNGDGDATDHIVTLASRASGRTQALGAGGAAPGRAVVRVRSGRFSFPAVAVGDDLLAFLEPEALQGGADANGNGRVFETILRAYRLGATSPTDLLAGLSMAADAAPLIDGRSLAVSQGQVLFRAAEADSGQLVSERVSVGMNGADPDGDSFFPSISDNGRFVAFSSQATNLVAGDANGVADAFVRDRLRRRTERVSVDTGNVERAGGGIAPVISGDGMSVAFFSDDDYFVYDRRSNTTVRTSVLPGDEVARVPRSYGTAIATAGALSRDGRLFAFLACVPPPAGAIAVGPFACRYYVRDLVAATTSEVGVALDCPSGQTCLLESLTWPVLSRDGRFVAYQPALAQAVLHEIATGIETIESRAPDGEVANFGTSGGGVSLSEDARWIAFESNGTNLATGDTNGLQDAFLRDRRGGDTVRVSLGSSGEQLPEARFFQDRRPQLTVDGRLVRFSSLSAGLTSQTYLHDNLTGQTVPLAGQLSQISGDGRSRAFVVPGPPRGEVFVQSADPALADVTGDGDANDTVLAVLDASASGASVAVCPATQVSMARGVAAFLRPEAAGATPALPACPPGGEARGGVDLNGDGDAADTVVHLRRTAGQVENLGLAATAVALSPTWIAALASEAQEGGVSRNGDADALDDVVAVRATSGGSWLNLGRAASDVQVAGSTVAFLTPESAEGGVSLNGDGDADDQVLQVYDASSGTGVPTNVGQAAEELVIGKKGLVAFRTSEKRQGDTQLNGDSDLDDFVLQVYGPGAGGPLVNTHMAVTPCRFEACDPRLPYRVLGNTVRFLSFECDQGGPLVSARCPGGGTDLNGDGDPDDLVLEILNVAQLKAGASMAESRYALASAAAGVCTTTGAACATDGDCAGGGCFVPPGGCVVDLGTSCSPALPGGCGDGQYCQPTGGGSGTCRALQKRCVGGAVPGASCQSDAQCGGGQCAARCRGSADCSDGAICNQSDQSFQRLVSPLKLETPEDAGAVMVGAGRCLERRSDVCLSTSDCPRGELCDGGQCFREHGTCRTADDCPGGATCEPDLIAQTAADSDGDEVPDFLDNCPSDRNPNQRDRDGDGIGDKCDPADGRRRTRDDYDADAIADFAIYEKATGGWRILGSAVGPLQILGVGGTGFLPVQGDYDGDRLTDAGAYEKATGNWTYGSTVTGVAMIATALGGPGFLPVQGDYDGDGKTDPAVYQKATGNWTVLASSAGLLQTLAFGGPGFSPMPADYDGDGKTDFGVYQKATGVWVARTTEGVETSLASGIGGPGFTPVAADYDGDRKADPAAYGKKTGLWVIQGTVTGRREVPGIGGRGFLPVPADYDGDRKADVGAYRKSTGRWLYLGSRAGSGEVVGLGGTGFTPAVGFPAIP